MKTDNAFEYRNAARATQVAEAAARSGMKPAEIAVYLDVAESTVRMWKAKPDAVIDAGTARKVRRLEKRIGKRGSDA